MNDVVIDVVIPNGEAISTAVYLGTKTLVGVEMPDAWTAANLTLQAAVAETGTYNNVYDKAGTEFTITAAASRAIGLGSDDLIGIGRWIKVRSGTSGVPVNQGAARTLKLILKGE